MKNENTNGTIVNASREGGPRRRRGFRAGLMLCATGLTACLATAPQARATLINYSLSDTIGVIDENRGNLAYTATANGTFTFDTSNNFLTNVNISLTNAYDNGATSILTDVFSNGSGSNYFYIGSTFNPTLYIYTASSLADDASTAILGSEVYVNYYVTNTGSGSGTVSVAAVPEPASFLVLLGGILAFFSLARRMPARRKAAQI